MIYKIHAINSEIGPALISHFKTEHLANSWIASRIALKKCLSEYLGLQLELDIKLPDDFELLSLANYSKLINFPAVNISISHTKNIGAACCNGSARHIGVGIDIELAQRKISSGIERKAINPADNSSANLLEIWSMKEAAFKALDPIKEQFGIGDRQLVLQDISILDKKFALYTDGQISDAIGELNYQQIETAGQTLIVATAQITRRD
ncbi:MAG TPA: 4'-phosphopantetheinyl transferase superfamily protein [Bacteriovoracaceae bacterium]|nr:4'-phosphopantetheinyl transferase superfamily protein [Bacteriovoracaceae bacterium]